MESVSVEQVGERTGAPSAQRLAKARWAASTIFLFFGISIGTLASRIPAIKQSTGVSDAQLGTALMASLAGGVLAMQLTARLMHRFGSDRTSRIAMVGVAIATVLPGLAEDFRSLVGALFILGVCTGVLDTAIHTNGTILSATIKRPLLSVLQGLLSLGALMGALVGAQSAHFGLSPFVHFSAVAVCIAIVGYFSAGRLLTEPRLRGEHATENGIEIRWSRKLILLALIYFCSALSEGAATSWSVVLLHDEYGATPAVAAGAYISYSLSMCVSRFMGDRLTVKLGRERLLQVGGLVGGVGLGAGLMSHAILIAFLGWMILGAGLATVTPVTLSLAAELFGKSDKSRSQAIARVSGVGWLGNAVGPLLVGNVAELVSLRWALSIPALLAICIAFAATGLKRP